jgi:hypothetical protein
LRRHIAPVVLPELSGQDQRGDQQGAHVIAPFAAARWRARARQRRILSPFAQALIQVKTAVGALCKFKLPTRFQQ